MANCKSHLDAKRSTKTGNQTMPNGTRGIELVHLHGLKMHSASNIEERVVTNWSLRAISLLRPLQGLRGSPHCSHPKVSQVLKCGASHRRNLSKGLLRQRARSLRCQQHESHLKLCICTFDFQLAASHQDFRSLFFLGFAALRKGGGVVDKLSHETSIQQ